MVPDISAFPCVVCWPLFGSNGGHSFRHTFRYVMIVTLADLHPVYPVTGYPLATTPPPSSTTSAGIFASAIRVGCRDDLVDFPSSEAKDERTFSCLLHAGWSWGQRGLGGGSLTPTTLPFGPGVLATSTCWFSRRSHRFLSSAWVQGWSVNHVVASSAELLSAGSIPRCLPSIGACCVALMPLSWHISFQSNLLLR
jgi:hypothetical protein